MSCLEDTASQSHSCFREYSDDRTKNTDTCIIQYFKILLTSEK